MNREITNQKEFDAIINHTEIHSLMNRDNNYRLEIELLPGKYKYDCQNSNQYSDVLFIGTADTIVTLCNAEKGISFLNDNQRRNDVDFYIHPVYGIKFEGVHIRSDSPLEYVYKEGQENQVHKNSYSKGMITLVNQTEELNKDLNPMANTVFGKAINEMLEMIDTFDIEKTEISFKNDEIRSCMVAIVDEHINESGIWKDYLIGYDPDNEFSVRYLTRAAKKICQGKEHWSEIVLLLSDSLFHEGNSGIVLTAKGVYVNTKSNADSRFYIDYKAIASMSLESNILIINSANKKYTIDHASIDTECFKALINVILDSKLELGLV